jgi:hypothetical protein
MFAANFKRGQEREAQLCVYVGERMVVDLWGSAAGDQAGHLPLFFCFNFFVVDGVMFFEGVSSYHGEHYRGPIRCPQQSTLLLS